MSKQELQRPEVANFIGFRTYLFYLNVLSLGLHSDRCGVHFSFVVTSKLFVYRWLQVSGQVAFKRLRPTGNPHLQIGSLERRMQANLS